MDMVKAESDYNAKWWLFVGVAEGVECPPLRLGCCTGELCGRSAKLTFLVSFLTSESLAAFTPSRTSAKHTALHILSTALLVAIAFLSRYEYNSSHSKAQQARA